MSINNSIITTGGKKTCEPSCDTLGGKKPPNGAWMKRWIIQEAWSASVTAREVSFVKAIWILKHGAPWHHQHCFCPWMMLLQTQFCSTEGQSWVIKNWDQSKNPDKHRLTNGSMNGSFDTSVPTVILQSVASQGSWWMHAFTPQIQNSQEGSQRGSHQRITYPLHCDPCAQGWMMVITTQIVWKYKFVLNVTCK